VQPESRIVVVVAVVGADIIPVGRVLACYPGTVNIERVLVVPPVCKNAVQVTIVLESPS